MIRYLQGIDIAEWLWKVPRRNRPQKLQTHNVPTDDVENTNSTN